VFEHSIVSTVPCQGLSRDGLDLDPVYSFRYHRTSVYREPDSDGATT